MNPRSCGAPGPGAPFFLRRGAPGLAAAGLVLALLGSAAAAVPDAAPSTVTAAADRAILTADTLTYVEPDQITAQGRVRLVYGAVTLTAQEAWADLQTRQVHAEGDVVLVESGREIRCAELDYDLTDGSARARGILYATYPWYYQGESVEKQGQERVLITESLFTTCNARHPHYHIEASRIDIILGESLTAYHAVLYVGATPLLYLPWFQRSLKDGRPPFSIRAGYNTYEGAYVKMKLNYYLAEENYGALLLNLMQYRGWAGGLEQHVHYELWGKGRGDAGFLYVRDTLEQRTRWTAKVDLLHELGPADQLQLYADYVSDENFNRDFSSILVDTYQQKSYLAYSHRDNAYYLGLSLQDVETLDPDRGVYLPYSRELPNLNWSLSSRPLARWGAPLYFSASASVLRSLETLRKGEQRAYRYRSDASLNPAFTLTVPLSRRIPTQPSLSATLSLPVTGYDKEDEVDWWATDQSEPSAETKAGYASRVTLTNQWVNYQKTTPTHLVQSTLAYEFARSWSLAGRPLDDAGVGNHRTTLAVNYYMGQFFRLQTQTGYVLLPREEGEDWTHALENLSLSGSATLAGRIYLNWQGTYAWNFGRWSNGFLSATTRQADWSLSVNGSYAYSDLSENPHTVYTTVTAGYQPWEGLGLQAAVQADLTRGLVNRYTLAASQDLHCWAVQASATVYQDGTYSLGLGLQLKAFPEIQTGFGGTDIALGE